MSAHNPYFDESHIPKAYFISFRCYGTWLHGDARGSVDMLHNTYRTSFLSPNPKLEAAKLQLLKSAPIKLDAIRRNAVESAIRETCEIRNWWLLALNVRTEHVHIVVDTGARDPELTMSVFKANATRKMTEADAWQQGQKPWSRHGSTRWLWTTRSVDCAIEYVINGQGNDLPNFDDWK